MCAYTPLTSDLLLSAIRVSSEGESLDLASEITTATLQDLCNNLLVLDSQRGVWRFSHISVLEYFEKKYFDIDAAHNHVTKVCLKLLLGRHKEPGSTNDMLRPRHPLQVYSWRNMAAHLQTQDPRPSDSTLDSMLAALQETPWGSVLLFAARNRDTKQEALFAVRLGFQFQGISPRLFEVLLDATLYRYYRLFYSKDAHQRRLLQRPQPEHHQTQEGVGIETNGMSNVVSFPVSSELTTAIPAAGTVVRTEIIPDLMSESASLRRSTSQNISCPICFDSHALNFYNNFRLWR